MNLSINRVTRRVGDLFQPNGHMQSPPTGHTDPGPTAALPPDVPGQVAFYRAWLHERFAVNNLEGNRRASAEYAEEALPPVVINGSETNPFAPYRPEFSAAKVITTGQLVVVGLLLAALVVGFLVLGIDMLALIMAGITIYYFITMLLQFWLAAKTFNDPQDIKIDDAVIHALADADWPRYTVLCPLYQEAESAPQLVRALREIDYPTDKLQVLIMLEKDDPETLAALQAQNPPDYIEIMLLPEGKPRTKPRSCNYGFAYATGDYVVIYDAEDIPDPLQLKKAVLAFAQSDEKTGCVQAKLNFYNTEQNALTRWFTVEYSAWYEMVMPGLQWSRITIPLGGTSNHFPAKLLREFGAWDAFNVTEDCDLGIRLADFGYNTVVLDSTTYEEANSVLKNWIRQRSRWIKGFIITYMVHMRRPWRFLHPSRWKSFLSLQWVIMGRTAVNLINPFLWAMIPLYWLLRPLVAESYQELFPPAVFYMALTTLIFGNLLYIYTHIIGAIRIGEHRLIKWTLIMPFYWMLSSFAGYIALWQYITKPHFWEKTKHGLHHQPRTEAKPEEVETHPVNAGDLKAGTPTTERPEPRRRATLYDGVLATKSQFTGREKPAEATAPRRFGWLKLPGDQWLTATILIALLAGLAATIYFFTTNQILLYKDANYHLLTARRIFDSINPGLHQLGGVWLPLPHLLMTPLTTNEFLFRSGLAGSIVGLACFIVAAMFLYLTARRLTGNSVASLLGTLAFVLNPNILYIQSTPMTELVFFATMAAACYYFLLWAQHGHSNLLIPVAIATYLMTLTRYDGWPIFFAFLILIGIIGYMRRERWARIEGNLITFSLFGAMGILTWLVWNQLVFGDVFFFLRGEYASSTQQQQLFLSEGLLFAYNDLLNSMRFFGHTAIVNVGLVLMVLGALGVIVQVVRHRLKPDTLAAFTLLIPIIFYIYSLYRGQIVIFLPDLTETSETFMLLNVRYGLVALPAVAVFLAVLINFLWQPASQFVQRFQPLNLHPVKYRWHYGVASLFLVIILGQKVVTTATGVITLEDGQRGFSCERTHEIPMYMAQHYDGGYIMGTSFAFPVYTFSTTAGIDFRYILDETSGDVWDAALRNPGRYADWLVVNTSDPTDAIYSQVALNSTEFLNEFQLVVEQANGFRLYKHRLTPVAAEPRELPPSFFMSGSDSCPD